ncbi:MAG: hypothetical protein ACI32N_10155 [Bulleidia sp.]
MSRKTMFGALAVAAGVAAALAVKIYHDTKKDDQEEDGDVHFITIDSDDEEKKEEPQETGSADVEGKTDEVKEVCAVFPYLKPDFVEEILVRDAEFRTLKGEDELVSVSHNVRIDNAVELEKFIAIMDEAGYAIEVEGTSAKVTRKFFAKQGAITSDILNVSNQTAALNGVYEGFEVE